MKTQASRETSARVRDPLVAHVHRSGAAAGFVFSALFSVGILFAGSGPDVGRPAASFPEFYADPGQRASVRLGAWALALCAPAFAWFAAALAQRLRGGGALGGVFMSSIRAAGAAFVALLLAAAAVYASVPIAIDRGSAVPGAEIAMFLPQVGSALLFVGASVAAAALLVLAAIQARRTASLPKWLAVAAPAVGVVIVATGSLMPTYLLPGWIFAASVHMLRLQGGKHEDP